MNGISAKRSPTAQWNGLLPLISPPLGDMFTIEILEEPCEDPDFDAWGRITIDDFSEKIGVCFINGDISITLKSWCAEFQKLLDGRNTVAIRPEPSFAWIFWRENEDVYIQQQFVLAEGWSGSFDTAGNIVTLPERQNVNERAEKISEWKTSLSNIRDFLNCDSLNGK